MTIIINENFLIDEFESTPIFKVVDDSGSVLFEGVTEEECQEFIDTNN